MSEKDINGLELAVIGMACRFPGADNVEAYWENLKNGVESITFLTDDELENSNIPPEVIAQPNYVKAASLLKDVERFDASFFGYSPKEAALLDPQHRLFLETAWHALENAGYNAKTSQDSVGVFAGTNLSSYLINNLLGNRKMNANADGFLLQIANDKDNLATRTSYKLNLNGPSVTLQTACSTSLVAVHFACQSLLNYESDMALAGGVSVRVPQKAGYTYQDELIFSHDGHCRPFDADASGTIFGSGVGIVVLKRLEDALEGGNEIIAVIKGSAVNNDGAAKIGFTAPGRKGQEQVLKSAMAMADVTADTIGAVENHGTGTILGDPLEIEALSRVWMSQTEEKQTCAIGSVKSNFGHLECAAGIASFIKMCLCLKNKWLVPTVNFNKPNPHINFEQSPFYVNVDSKAWVPRNGTPLRGSVSSFGIGGTNAHVVLEAAPEKRKASESRPVQLLLLSARTANALENASQNLLQYLKENDAQELADIAHTLRNGRSEFRHRRSLVCRDINEVIETLESLDAQKTATGVAKESSPKVVFMFPGQGSQYVGMGREIYDQETVFKEKVDRCAEILKKRIGRDIRELIFAEDASPETAARLNQTDMAQPALFTIEYALSKLFMSWGITPDFMIGHSIGEYVAASLSGVLSLEDALLVVAKRAGMMNAMPEGDMAVINLPEDEVTPLLSKELSIAAVNGPSFTVVSGPSEAVKKMVEAFSARDVHSTILHTSHAFHSEMMAPCAASLSDVMGTVSLGVPVIPYISNLTGEEISAEQAADPQYWSNHLLNPVQFGPGIKALSQLGDNLVFLEVGPGRTLNMLTKNNDNQLNTISSLPHACEQGASSLAHLMGSVGKLWNSGVCPDWRAFQGDEIRNLIPLPGYPFEQKRYWAETTPSNDQGEETESILMNIAVEEDPDDSSATQSAYIAPQTPLEIEIATMLKRVLGVEKVGVKDDFLDLGGHSLLATQFLDQLNKHFGSKIKLNAFFADPTIAGLVNKLGDITLTHPAAEATADDMPKVIMDTENRYEPYPLREMQQAQWIGRLGNFSMSNVAAHVYFESEKKDLDLNRLQASWQNMIKRHETLRGIILPEGGQQILADPGPYTIQNADLRQARPEEIEPALLKIREAMDHVMRPTDQWPLFEIRTSQLPDNRTRIHFSIDLLICDVSSLRILLNEWAADYNGKPLPELELSFRDYVIAEEKIKETEKFAISSQYWEERIKELPPAPMLPLAKNPEEITRPVFKRWSMRLEPEAWDRFKAQAIEKRISPSVALLSAFGYVLGNWSKSQRFCLNTTIINRMTALHPHANDIIGEFSSFAPLEINLESDKTFSDNASEVMAQNWKNLEYRYLSGVSVLRKLAQSGGATTGSVLPVVFTSTLVQKLNDDYSPTFGGFDYVISQTPQVWLDHCVLEDNYGLVLSWHAVEGLFPEGMIDTMWDAYANFVTRLATHTRAWEENYHNLLPAQQLEERQVINSVAGDIPDTLLHAPFFEQAEKNPDKIAIIAGSTQLSYSQTANYADRLAGNLRKNGMQPGDVVAIVMEKGWQQVLSALAILRAGGVYLGIDPHVPAERLEYLLATADVKTVLTVAEFDRQLEWPEFVERCVVSAAHISRMAPCQLDEARTPDDLAYIIYTSGSTGQPKGVMVSHRSALNTIVDMNRRFEVGENDRVLGLSELNFDLSVYDVFGVLAAGGALVLPSPGSGRDPKHWLDLVREHKVTMWNSVPAFVEMFVEYAQSRATELPLRLFWMSGDWIPVTLPERIKQFIPQSTVVSLGGATEAAIWSIIYVISEVKPEWESIPYGKPLANQQFHVLNENLDACPVHVPGELYIGGIGVALGYWKDAEKTQKAFITHPRTGERLYRTGDFGRFMPDGNIEFLGREDLQVKISGFRIELGEIEAALSQCPQIHSAVVNVWEPAPGKKRLAGYIVPEPGAETDTEALRAFLKQKLPQYMIPNEFVLLEEFPLSANGKVDRNALPAPHQTKKTGAPKAETGYSIKKLIPIFERVVGVENIDINENFFAMGGDSITGIRVVNEAAAEGIEIAPQQLFERQTIAALAEVIKVEMPPDNALETMAGYKGRVSLTPYQDWFFKRHQYSLKYMNHAVLMKTMTRFNPEVIETALQFLVKFHDALQVRFVKQDDGWVQEYHEAAQPAELDFVDVTGLSTEDVEKAVRNMRAELADMQDLAASPLLKLCVLQDSNKQVSHLLLIAHQLIMDHRSLDRFFEDLYTVCRQIDANGEAEFLKRPRFKTWADQHLAKRESKAVQDAVKHLETTLPEQLPDLRLTKDSTAQSLETTYSIQLDEKTTYVLLEESLGIYKTSLEEFALIALTLAFIKGDHADSLYLDCLASVDPGILTEKGLTDAVGNFIRPCPMYLEIETTESVYKNIRLLKDRIRNAGSGEHAGMVYNLADLSEKALPEILFCCRQDNQEKPEAQSALEKQWVATASALNYGGGPYALEIHLGIVDGRFEATWNFDAARFSLESVQKVATAFVDEVTQLVAHQIACDMNVLSASDFQDADVDQEELEKLFNFIS